MKNTKDKVLNVLKKVKGGVIDTTATVIAAPKVTYYKAKENAANMKYDDMMKQKKLKQMDEDGVEDEGNEKDDLFRFRINEINKAFDNEQARRGGSKDKQLSAVKSKMLS